MVSIKLFILCVGYFVLQAECSKVPYLEVCVWTDHNCLLNSGNKVLPHFAVGIPELDTPAVDPLHIKQAIADTGTLKLKFDDLTVVGLKKAVLQKVEADSDKSTLNVVIETPITVTGIYTAGGSLLGVPVEGHGKTKLETAKVKLTVKAKLQKFDKDGSTYYKIEKYDLKFKFIEQLVMEFDNLFNGDKTLAEPVSAVIDKNWKDLVPDVGKGIVKEVGDIVVAAMNKMLSVIPADQLEKHP